MTVEQLFRLSGLSAILAGIFRAVNSILPNGIQAEYLELLYFFTDVFILFGLLGLYLSQFEKAGIWGFAGFLISMVGIGSIIGPDGEIFGISGYVLGASLFSAGLIIFSFGTLKAGKFPRWIPICWILSTIIGFLGFFTPGLSFLFVFAGILFGIGFACAGFFLLSANEK